VLRQQGLHAWIALVIAEPPSSPRAEAPPPSWTLDPFAAAVERSPLVCLWSDMLLSTFTTPIPQELR